MYSGDEMYPDEITSGPIPDDGVRDEECNCPAPGALQCSQQRGFRHVICACPCHQVAQ